jgi:ATP-dependent Lon protease
VSKLQAEIKESVDQRISKTQRDFMLHEQLKSIKKELGMEKDDKEALLAKFQERVDKAVGVPASAAKVIDEELRKLGMLERNSAEFNTSRSYLDWLTQLPWGRHTEDSLDVAKAREVLDKDHYGLDEVKRDLSVAFISAR